MRNIILAVLIPFVLVAPFVARASEPGTPQRMHDIRIERGEEGAEELVACDELLLAAYDAREKMQSEIERFRHTRVMPDPSFAEQVRSDAHRSEHLALCRDRFGDVFAYETALPRGRPVNLPWLLRPIRMPALSCGERLLRIIEIKHELSRRDHGSCVGCGQGLPVERMQHLVEGYQQLAKFCPAPEPKPAPLPPPAEAANAPTSPALDMPLPPIPDLDAPDGGSTAPPASR